MAWYGSPLPTDASSRAISEYAKPISRIEVSRTRGRADQRPLELRAFSFADRPSTVLKRSQNHHEQDQADRQHESEPQSRADMVQSTMWPKRPMPVNH